MFVGITNYIFWRGLLFACRQTIFLRSNLWLVPNLSIKMVEMQMPNPLQSLWLCHQKFPFLPSKRQWEQIFLENSLVTECVLKMVATIFFLKHIWDPFVLPWPSSRHLFSSATIFGTNFETQFYFPVISCENSVQCCIRYFDIV